MKRTLSTTAKIQAARRRLRAGCRQLRDTIRAKLLEQAREDPVAFLALLGELVDESSLQSPRVEAHCRTKAIRRRA